jgi:hypothetical protein
MDNNTLLGLLSNRKVNMLQRPAEPYLRSAAPSLYGFLGGLMGTAPDEMAGSVMDPNTAAVQDGASYGYLPGLLAGNLPIGKAGAGLAMLAGATKGAGQTKDALAAGAGALQRIGKVKPTVMRPQRVAYPGIYGNPADLAAEAASRVAPESPLLKQLFDVSRDDLWNISQQGNRAGNIVDRPFNAAANAKGAAHASEVMNPRNVGRIQDLIGEAQTHPDLYQGMASWYTMDPLYKRFVDIYGPEEAVNQYNKFNTLTGMASPGSEVLTEFNRGTGANWLATQGRFDDFQTFGGLAEHKRGLGFPDDMRGIIGHPYHSTAQSGPMGQYLASGNIDGMGSAKVPSYIAASGVPETGFQTQWPVGDAHWSRLVGLPDVRGARTSKGVEVLPNASASVPEMTALGPWWKDKIAEPMGLQAVPAQAVVWGAGSGATGVTSPIGAGKLELLAQQIGKAADRMGVSPETARDMIIRGQAHAGVVDPELAALLAAGTGAGLLGYSLNSDQK